MSRSDEGGKASASFEVCMMDGVSQAPSGTRLEGGPLAPRAPKCFSSLHPRRRQVNYRDPASSGLLRGERLQLRAPAVEGRPVGRP